MSKSQQSSISARTLLLDEYHGVLSTHSVEMEGYPFGSVVPYCLDRTGQPIILISRIAQHTKNILQNAKVSLIVTEREVDDIQTGARLTLLALAEKLEDPESEGLNHRYYRFFPEAADYHLTHDFDFYRLNIQRARYIGGFGKIHWIDSEDLTLDNPFKAEEEKRIVDHMNEDHADALGRYAQQFDLSFDQAPTMVGIDSEGLHLLGGQKVARIPFERNVSTALEAREILVEMTKR